MSKIYKRQLAARKRLDDIWEHPGQVSVIHYSCESFYNRADGTSPRITSIAIRNLGTAQTQSFSIHKFAELNGYPIDKLDNCYDEFEKQMLKDFYESVRTRMDHKWVHWNMRDGNYGFYAIELRYKILGGEPVVIQENQKFDLARLLYEIYGKGYAPHGRLESLVDINEIRSKNFKTGAEEAELFKECEYVTLHQSTLAKVSTLADICQMAYENNLKTNAKFWNLHCHSIEAFMVWCIQHPYICFPFMLLSAIVNVLFFFDFF